MILLLGGSGYVGNAYRLYFERKEIPFHSLSRSQVDYSSFEALTAALRAHKPEFLINAAGYHGKAQCGCL